MAMSVAVEEIGHVVRGRLHLLDLVVELVVDGAQLLVEGLQLLLGGLQLLVGGLEFLVHRHDFFVRRLEFLVGTLQLLDGALQVIARGLQLLLELAQQIRLCRLGAFLLRPAFHSKDSAAPGTRSAADLRSVWTG